MSALQNRRALFMKKAIVMAGVLFALTMTAGCGSQNQDHAATAESQTQDTAG